MGDYSWLEMDAKPMKYSGRLFTAQSVRVDERSGAGGLEALP
jgi:hypothetical protein